MFKRLGFIGAGKQAREHARAAQALGAEVILTAVTSKTSENIEGFPSKDGFLYNNNSANGWELLLKESDLDAIIVCAPWNVIPKMMPELMACDLPMLIEKPVFLDDVIDISWSNKYVAMNRRFYGSVAELKKQITGHEIVSVEAVWSDATEDLESRHKGITPYLMEMYSIHMIDLLYYLFGEMEIEYKQNYSHWGSFDAVLSPNQQHLKTFPIHLSITQNNPQKSGITIRTRHGGCIMLSPLEELNVYRRMEIIESGGFRRYQPQYSMRRYESPGGLKPGIRDQMEAFLKQDTKKLATIGDAIYIHNLINELRY